MCVCAGQVDTHPSFFFLPFSLLISLKREAAALILCLPISSLLMASLIGPLICQECQLV